MELRLNYKGKDFNKLRDLIVKTYNDVSSRFEDELNNLTVCVHKNRKEFDKKLNLKTKLWHIASASNEKIDIIHFGTRLANC